MENRNGMPHVKTLSMCLQKMVSEGYVNDFSYVDDGVMMHQTKRVYSLTELKVTNTLKFEGSANPDENAVLYVIETNDGMKGTLVDAFGIYPKSLEGRFAALLK